MICYLILSILVAAAAFTARRESVLRLAGIVFYAVQAAFAVWIAAGGLYTGEDIYRIMELGADGVQLGSKFVTTEECDASQAFKDT